MFGHLMTTGGELPDFQAARNSLVRDENGRIIHEARSENRVEEPEGGATSKKKRRKIMDLDAYHETELLRVVRLSDAAVGVDEAKDLVQMGTEITKHLSQRGFIKDIELVYVTGSKKQSTPDRSLLDILSGVYHRRPDRFNDRPVYQKVFLHPDAAIGIACKGLYIFWSAVRDAWKIGALDDDMAGLAICCEDKPLPAELEKPWSIFDFDADRAPVAPDD